MTLDELKARLDEFSPAKVEFVSRMVDSLSRPPQVDVGSETWITASPDWVEYFGLSLSVHHGATPEPLALTAFETAFRNACGYVRWPVDEPGSLTRRFVDVTVDAAGETRKLSLKSTAARDLSETTAHISKLTEAAWIQDARTPGARRDAMLDLFRQYREAVSAILMLRAFRTDAGTPPQRYQLVEIPVRLFDSIHESSLRDFERDAPAIACRVDGETVAHVAVDRSDAKITVRRIRLSACVVHAEWRHGRESERD